MIEWFKRLFKQGSSAHKAIKESQDCSDFVMKLLVVKPIFLYREDEYQGTSYIIVRDNLDNTYFLFTVDFGSCTGCDEVDDFNSDFLREKDSADFTKFFTEFGERLITNSQQFGSYEEALTVANTYINRNK